MATRNDPTAPAEAQPSESTTTASFDKLLSRLLNLVHHVRLVDQRLFDLQGVPEDLQPAAVALHDATEALDELHTEFDSWHTHGLAGSVETAGEPAAGGAVEPSPVDPAAFQASVERFRAFDASSLGEAISNANGAVSAAISLIDCATRSLERDDGNGIDHEVAALEIALERLREATEHLDRGQGIGARAYEPAGMPDATDVPAAALDAQGWLNVAARHLGQAPVALNTAFEEAVPDSEEEYEAREARESVEIAYGIVKTEGARP